MDTEYSHREYQRPAAGDLSTWLGAEVEERGWFYRESGRRSGLSALFASPRSRSCAGQAGCPPAASAGGGAGSRAEVAPASASEPGGCEDAAEAMTASFPQAAGAGQQDEDALFDTRFEREVQVVASQRRPSRQRKKDLVPGSSCPGLARATDARRGISGC